MAKEQESRPAGGERTRDIGRRDLLEGSAVGGLALAAGLFGFGRVAEAGAPQTAALEQTVATGRMRRVVTGHDGDGKSYIIRDEVVGINELWTTTAEQPLGEGPAGEQPPRFHTTGASRIFVAPIAPSPDPKPSLENRVGFHKTSGVAYCIVLNGELVFLVDKQEVRLKAGDLVVERGTDHSWRNEGNAPVGLLVAVVTAET